MPIITIDGQEFAEVEVTPAQPAVKKKYDKQQVKEMLDNWQAQKQQIKDNYDREMAYIQANIDKLKVELNLFK